VGPGTGPRRDPAGGPFHRLTRLGAGPWRWPSRPPLRVWVWTAASVALVVVAALLWRGSDAAATQSTTATPAGVPSGTPAGAVSAAWSVTGAPLPEQVVESGRVIVGTPHGVRALDVTTGAEAWHYLRGNAALCGMTVTDGVAVAVFRTADRCDEGVALDAGTGVRRWTRNMDFRPDATLDSTDRIVLAASPGGVVALDPTGDSIRWRYAPPESCRLLGSDVGSAGVAVLQRCGGTAAAQLRLLDGFSGDPHWSRDLRAPEGTAVRLLGADRPVGVVVGDEVQLLSPDDGSVLSAFTPDGAADAAQTVIARTALVWSGGRLYAVEADTGHRRWDAPALGLPGATEAAKLAAGAGAVVVPSSDGFVARDLMSGDARDRSAVSGLPPGGSASTVGPVIVYRVGDRVLGYR
jgi:outer membrane protein assembly factor BamB